MRAVGARRGSASSGVLLRGGNLGYTTVQLLRLLDDYGAEELRAAVKIAVEREAFGAGSVAHILEQRRRGRA